MGKRTEEILGVDGDTAAFRVLMSNAPAAKKKAELARLSRVHASALSMAEECVRFADDMIGD